MLSVFGLSSMLPPCFSTETSCLEGAVVLLRLACLGCLQEEFHRGVNRSQTTCAVLCLAGKAVPPPAAALGRGVLVCPAVPSARWFLFHVQILISSLS